MEWIAFAGVILIGLMWPSIEKAAERIKYVYRKVIEKLRQKDVE